MSDEMVFDIKPEQLTIDREVVALKNKDSADMLEHATAFVVCDAKSYQYALQLGAEYTAGGRSVEQLWEPQKKQAHELHKGITGIIKKVATPFFNAAEILSKKAYAWKKVEDDRLRKEELARQQAEQKRLEDEKLAQAEKLKAEGKSAEADRVLEEPVRVEPKKVEVAPKVEGISTKENWQFEIVDASKIPDEYWIPDEKTIGQVVKATKGKTNIPGIRIYDAGTVAFRRS